MNLVNQVSQANRESKDFPENKELRVRQALLAFVGRRGHQEQWDLKAHRDPPVKQDQRARRVSEA